MNNLNFFQKFVAKKSVEQKSNFLVWSYTRVSSKEQFDKNSSVERQIEASRAFANSNNYQITEEFGGTYESAKSDFTRKEFKRLFDKVTASRKKPYAILVYKMSRFSRSGGNAIGLVNALVEDLGVHLIEVCSQTSTTTERGKAAIYESLFHAYKENLEKKEIIIPSMQAFLKKGNWFGNCPLGYDHYGPRVQKEKFLSRRQRFEINKDGKLLIQAWEWKASGMYSDAQILSKLAALGLRLCAQKISKIWRNPFYCGILINRLLDEPVKGNWEPLVGKENFIKVQDILAGNPSGYQHVKEEEKRPLTRLLKCNECKAHMVGYVNKKKNLHYYRCLKCNGVSMNAITTVQAKRKGGNDLFKDFLMSFSIPQDITPLVTLQLTKIFNHYHTGKSQNEETLKNQYETLEKKLKDLKIRYGLGDIDKETYDLALEHISNQMQLLSKELNNLVPAISNLEKLIAYSLEKLQNLSEIWGSSDLDNKRRIQKTLFPDGIYYNAKNHEYLTVKINSFLLLTQCFSSKYEGKKLGNSQTDFENSLSVARMGIEPITSGL